MSERESILQSWPLPPSLAEFSVAPPIPAEIPYRFSELLIDNGFEPDVVTKYFGEEQIYTESEWAENLSAKDFDILIDLAKTPASRLVLAREMSNDHRWIHMFTAGLENIKKASESRPEVAGQFTEILTLMGEVDLEGEEHDYHFMSKFSSGIEILTSPDLVSLFGNDPKVVHTFMEEIQAEGHLGYLQMGIASLKSSPNISALLDGLDSKILKKIININVNADKGFARVPTAVEVCELLNEYAKGDDNWANRILAFKPILRAGGLPVVDGAEANPGLISRIRKTENPKHIWNSMDLAPLTGPEWEYPKKDDIFKVLTEKGLYDALALVGFRRGNGDTESADEASPGPFSDPLTSMVVYLQYADAGIINAKTKYDLSFHFNVSRIESSDNIVKVIRTLQLMGIGYNPWVGHRRGSLWIEEADGVEGTRRFEAKDLRIQRDVDAVLAMKTAGFLMWGDKAEQQLEDNLPGQRYRSEMAGLWNEWDEKMVGMLNSYGHGRLFASKDNRNEDAFGLTEELKKIYTDESFATVPDVTKVGQLQPEDPIVDGIKGVWITTREGQKKWCPNVVAAAQEITRNAVSGIESVANKSVSDCEADIEKIDKSKPGYKRNRLVRRFVNKYGIAVDGEINSDSRERAYKEVRDVMLQ